MVENHEGDNTPKQCDVVDEKCPALPIPNDQKPGEIPAKITITEYNKVPPDKKAEIDEKKTVADRTAKKAKDDAELDNNDVRAEAKGKYDLATQKVNTLKEKYKSKILIEIEDLYKQYQTGLKSSLKKCTESVDHPEYIKAVATANYESELAKKTKEYLDAIKGFNSQESEASSAWEQAKKDYQSIQCKVNADYNAALKAAEFEWYSKMKEAVDAACD